MAYCTRTDIDNIYGTFNVAKWSQLDNDSAAANVERIAEAIADSDEAIDDRFRMSRYTVPFVPVPRKVKTWSARLAGIWLLQSRPRLKAEEAEGLLAMKQTVEDEMDQYLAGNRHLNSAMRYGDNMPTAPEVA